MALEGARSFLTLALECHERDRDTSLASGGGHFLDLQVRFVPSPQLTRDTNVSTVPRSIELGEGENVPCKTQAAIATVEACRYHVPRGSNARRGGPK